MSRPDPHNVRNTFAEQASVDRVAEARANLSVIEALGLELHPNRERGVERLTADVLSADVHPEERERGEFDAANVQDQFDGGRLS